MVAALVAENAQLPVPGGRERETHFCRRRLLSSSLTLSAFEQPAQHTGRRLIPKNVRVRSEMVLRAAVAPGFRMEISVFYVKADYQSHFGVGGKLFARSSGRGRSAEMKHRRIAPFQHISPY